MLLIFLQKHYIGNKNIIPDKHNELTHDIQLAETRSHLAQSRRFTKVIQDQVNKHKTTKKINMLITDRCREIVYISS